MREGMFFPKEWKDGDIISREIPKIPHEEKKVTLFRGIKKEEYNEVISFLEEQNKMSSGNITLLKEEQLEKYINLNLYSILMRSKNNNSLIGVVFSIPFPIRCSIVAGKLDNEEYLKEKIILHGCTTFLNVHSKLRGHGLCSNLISELSVFGHENNIFCSYQMTSFSMTKTSFPISSWFRPLNLPRSIGLGFVYPGFNEISKFHENRLKYKNKMPKKYSLLKIEGKNIEKALDFYTKSMENKKFVFLPDEKWFSNFDSYLILFEKEIVGIFSISPIYCLMLTGLEGKLCLPLLFKAKKEHNLKVLESLIFLANEKEYDVFYCYSVGDLTKNILTDVSAIETPQKTWFSLYNNSLFLTPSDLYVPLF